MKMTRRVLMLLFAGLLGLVGCGDDDDDTDAATGDDTEMTEAAGEGDVATYCEKVAEIEVTLGPGPDIDFESATPEELTQAAKEFAGGATDLAAEAQEAAPAEIRADIDVLVAALDDVAETGDFGAFETPEVEEASARTHAFDLESCDWQRVDVSAVNYAFNGIPAELEAGTTSFEFSNDGTELHELILIRKNDDTEESFDELLALPEEEARTKTTSVGAAFGAPGEEGVYAVTDLTAGEYLAICFIPVGTVDEESEADGPPHFTQGMKHEFRVS